MDPCQCAARRRYGRGSTKLCGRWGRHVQGPPRQADRLELPRPLVVDPLRHRVRVVAFHQGASVPRMATIVAFVEPPEVLRAAAEQTRTVRKRRLSAARAPRHRGWQSKGDPEARAQT